MQVCSACSGENPDGFRHCGYCGASLAAPESERRKLATLVFCDLSGSTAIGERVDPESVQELLRSYFHEMRAALERHGGTVEKFIGDAVVAVFGVPEAHEDDALRACRAALEMQARMNALNEELERRFGHAIAVRIGVNTGEVVTGGVRARDIRHGRRGEHRGAPRAGGRRRARCSSARRPTGSSGTRSREPVEPLDREGKVGAASGLPAARGAARPGRAAPDRDAVRRP